MKQKRLDEFKKILLTQMGEYKNSINQIDELINSNKNDESERFSVHNSRGSDAISDTTNGALNARSIAHLKRIEEALRRIDLGTFGICKHCKEEIDEERLEAVPTTESCRDCKVGESNTYINRGQLAIA